MNDVEVVKQVDQMVRFIKQEAEEKANEIMVSAEEEFNIEKLQMIEAEKQKIKKDYERKESQVEVKKKIEYSKKLNEMRLKVLDAKQGGLADILTAAKEDLGNVSKGGDYKDTLQRLIVQVCWPGSPRRWRLHSWRSWRLTESLCLCVGHAQAAGAHGGGALPEGGPLHRGGPGGFCPQNVQVHI
mmetsp:Transcript_4169/g.10720  ORF Transcript_4169/g.10720 Transcript_4169/m.10720 type:complete len:185 (+) Transcript_4169:141-695(+)